MLALIRINLYLIDNLCSEDCKVFNNFIHFLYCIISYHSDLPKNLKALFTRVKNNKNYIFLCKYGPID